MLTIEILLQLGEYFALHRTQQCKIEQCFHCFSYRVLQGKEHSHTYWPALLFVTHLNCLEWSEQRKIPAISEFLLLLVQFDRFFATQVFANMLASCQGEMFICQPHAPAVSIESQIGARYIPVTAQYDVHTENRLVCVCTPHAYTQVYLYVFLFTAYSL